MNVYEICRYDLEIVNSDEKKKSHMQETYGLGLSKNKCWSK